MAPVRAQHRVVIDAPAPTRSRTVIALVALLGFLFVLLGGLLSVLTPANAAPPSVPLGTAKPFAILAGSQVTNTGPSVINGDLGVAPGTAVTGFPPGQLNGVQHVADPVAQNAKASLVAAYNNAAGRPSTPVATELGNQTLLAGVYSNGTELGITGTVTLDGQNDPSSVWIFQAGSTLITGSNSRVALINGANPCNVFWQVGSSATLGTGTTFVGTIMALTSISVNSGTTVLGRALARNGAVTLNNNVFNLPTCAAPPTTTTPTTTSSTTTSTGTGTSTSTSTSTSTGTSTSTTTTAPTTTTGSTTTTAPTTTTSSTTNTSPTTTNTSPTTTATSTTGTSTSTSTGTSTTGTSTSSTAPTSTTTSSSTSGGGGGGNGGGNGAGGTGANGGGNGGGGNGAGNGNGGGSLAYTGSALPLLPLTSIGGGILLIGAALILLTRRPRPEHA